MRWLECVERVDIERPSAVVFELISSVDRWPGWLAGITDLERTSSATSGLGAAFTGRYRMFPGATYDLACEVTVYEPIRRAGRRTMCGPLVFEATQTLEPTSDGGTLLLNELRVGSPRRAMSWMLRLSAPLARRRIAKEARAELQRIKHAAEAT